jgi:hypothetical protein
MAEGPVGSDPVADALLQLLELGEASFGVPRPDRLAVDVDLEDAFLARPERHLGELALEGDEKLLSHPRRAKEPAAARAVGDSDARHARATA